MSEVRVPRAPSTSKKAVKRRLKNREKLACWLTKIATRRGWVFDPNDEAQVKKMVDYLKVENL